MKIKMTAIAYVRSEFKDNKKKITRDTVSTIVLNDEYGEEALFGIENFQYLEIIWFFHQSQNTMLMAHPQGNPELPLKGIFALRSPHRPNHIATTIVKLLKKQGKTITVYGLDAIDGSPVLDIKPADKIVKSFGLHDSK